MYALQSLGGTLTLRVEAAHGIDFIVPELNAYRGLLRDRKDIQNAAPHRKLPASVHFSAPLVAERRKLLRGLAEVETIARMDSETTAQKALRRFKLIHERVYGRHDKTAPALRNAASHIDTDGAQFVAAHIRRKKE